MKRIGVRELAQIANVSLGTVDRALNGRKDISETTRQRILQIAEQYGYRPNLTARALSVGQSSIRIGVCIPREIHYFYDQVRDGIMEESQKIPHFEPEILYSPVKGLGSKATKKIRELMESDVQALIITPSNPTEMVPLIEEAEKERNIRVISVATDDSLSCRSSSVCVDPRLNGGLAAELMAKVVPASAEVAVVTGIVSTEDNGQKVNAFCKKFPIDCPGGTIVQVIEGHEEEEETYKKTLRVLRKHPDLAGIYVSTVNCIPVCKAVEAQKRSGRIKVIATDLFLQAVPYFTNGTLTASIYQDPYRQGQIAVQLIVDHFMYGAAFPKASYLNPSIALRANLGLFRELESLPELAGEDAKSLLAS